MSTTSIGSKTKIVYSTEEPVQNVIVTGTFDNWSQSVEMTKDSETGVFVSLFFIFKTKLPSH
jgi:hypothetical protein